LVEVELFLIEVELFLVEVELFLIEVELFLIEVKLFGRGQETCFFHRTWINIHVHGFTI
jgi:hypothetical protein